MSLSVLSPAIPQLPSGNLQVTAGFFRDCLGFTDLEFFPEHGHLIVTRGPVEIHFWQAESEEEGRKYGSASSCYIRVRNIQPLYEELKAKGVPFAYELELKPWGMNEMQINDPYGNAIRFGEIVDAQSDE
jgi:uncharacterized glyoxalase superfamily protein PhnB